MDTLGVILVLLALAIGGLLLLASRKPDTFSVERRIGINAPGSVVFDQINTLKAWEAWSPWLKKDPAMRQTYSGPDAGVGASHAWEGNGQVGSGAMTITGSIPDQKIVMRLDFLKPFKATNFAEFTLQSDGSGTTIVIWAMTGQAKLITKVMDVLMNMDKMIGRDFEAGLASLKAVCEAKG